MPATSKKQQALFGIARAIQKGNMPASKASKAAKDIAKNVSAKEVEKFASTPTKGLPDKVKKESLRLTKSQLREMIKEMLTETANDLDMIKKQLIKCLMAKLQPKDMMNAKKMIDELDHILHTWK